MKAMILAAGLGTRLRPLTENTPKALIAVHSRPLIEWIILRLKKHGFNEIIINVHHHSEMIKRFLLDNKNFGLRLAVSDEKKLLDTGGGIKKAGWFFNDDRPFLVHNVDVLSDLDLNAVYNRHLEDDALATLAVRDRKTSRYLLFDNNLNLCGWKSVADEKKYMMKACPDPIPLSFMGIHVLSADIIRLFDEQPPFSIINTYLRLCAQDYPVKGYRADSARWLDLGRKENLRALTGMFSKSYFTDLSAHA